MRLGFDKVPLASGWGTDWRAARVGQERTGKQLLQMSRQQMGWTIEAMIEMQAEVRDNLTVNLGGV